MKPISMEAYAKKMASKERRRRRNREEDRELEKLAEWLREKGFMFTHPANEEPNAKRAIINKRKGVQPGVPDILIFNRTRWACGVAIEMKAKGRKPTPLQESWLAGLDRNGWTVSVFYSAEEAKKWLTSIYQLH